MSDFNIRSDSVDVEQIMRQIRARIRDKRGVDYTEQQIQELASAKLERFLDPTGVRSGLLEQYRSRLASEPPPMYAFEDTTLFDSDKAIVRFIRGLLKPVLKLFFNYNVLSQTLHTQAAYNHQLQQKEPLYFELIHNLVVELTRLSIDAKNLKMRVESLQSRLEFNERRARALEAVVQYRPDTGGDRRGGDAGGDRRGGQSQRGPAGPPYAGRQTAHQPTHGFSSRPADRTPGAATVPSAAPAREAAVVTEPQGGVDPITGGESLRTRRRRRRRRRGGLGVPVEGAQGAPQPMESSSPEEGDDEPDVDVIEGTTLAAAPAELPHPQRELVDATSAETPPVEAQTQGVAPAGADDDRSSPAPDTDSDRLRGDTPGEQ